MVELAAEMLKASQAEDDVRDIMVQAAELDTTNIAANFEAGRLHLRTIKKDQASKFLLRIYRQKPSYRFDLEYHIAASYQYGLQFDRAIEYYNRYKQKYQRQPGYQGKDKVSLNAIERKLFECNNGKEFIANPKPLAIVNIGPQINSEANDYAPVLNEKEDEIIFTSRRLDGNLNENVYSDNKPFEDIFISVKTNGKWSRASNIGRTVNIPNHNSNLALSPDGKTLFTYRDDNGGDIFVSELKSDNTWSPPKPLPGIINSPYMESSVSITRDGSTLYFASERPGGEGGIDIYSCVKDSRGNWSKVRNLGPTINSGLHEDGPFIDYSGKKLHFSSQSHKGMGGYDIFESDLINAAKNEWSEPMNVGYPINTPDNDIYFVGTADGKRGYYASVRDDGLGYLDVYTIIPKELSKTPAQVLPMRLVVKVIDAKTAQPLDVNIELLSITESKAVPLTNKAKGNYTFTVTTRDPKNYRLSVTHEGYFPQIEEITLQSADMVEKTVTQTVGMAKSDKVIKVLPLKFAVKVIDGKTNLLLEATVKLASMPDNTMLNPSPKGAGVYEFSIITPLAKTYKLSIEKTGYVSQTEQVNLEGAGTAEKTISKSVNLVPEKKEAVIMPLKYVVNVVDSKTNLPIDGLVKLESVPGNILVSPVQKGVGIFEFSIVSITASQFKLSVEKDGYMAQSQPVPMEAATTIEKVVAKTISLVELKKEPVILPIKITVKVVDEKTNLPIEATLKLESIGVEAKLGTTAKAAGTFDFLVSPLAAKEYSLTAERVGYVLKSEKFMVEAAGTVSKAITRTIALAEQRKEIVIVPLKLTVKVTDEKTKMPLEAKLKLESAGDAPKEGTTAKVTGQFEFTLASPTSKEYSITAQRAGYIEKAEKIMVEGAGATAKTVSQTITLVEVKKEIVLAPIKLVVKVSDEQTGLPLESKLKLETVGDAVKSGSTNKSTGTFEFLITSATSKDYSITMEKEGYVLKTEKLTVEALGEIPKTVTKTFSLKAIVKDVPIGSVAGVKLVVTIKAKNTNIPIEANVILQSAIDNNKIDGNSKGNGVYEFLVTSTKTGNYKISADREGYVYQAQQIRIEGATEKESTVARTISLQPISIGVTSVLRNLFFDAGKTTISKESYSELGGFENMMKQNPGIRVEISGHTDDIGDNTLNKNLSQIRANAVKTFLVAKGIDPKRLVAIGYGETRPLVSNDDEDGGREINRRVELKILNK